MRSPCIDPLEEVQVLLVGFGQVELAEEATKHGLVLLLEEEAELVGMLVELEEEWEVVAAKVLIHSQRDAEDREVCRAEDLWQVLLNTSQEGIIEELIFNRHLLAVVEHLKEEAGSSRREELFNVLYLVLAD